MLLAMMVLKLNVSVQAQQNIEKEAMFLLENPDLQGATIGMVFLDPRTGEELFNRGADVNMIPASSMKVLTTHAALEILGPEHRFKTEVIISGRLSESGVLDGDLIIRGYGDPTLGSTLFNDSDFLRQWVLALKNRGVREIKGAIISDDAYFEGPALCGSTPLEDGGNYYAAGAHGINVYDNTFEVMLSSGASAGDLCEIVGVNPSVPGLELVSEVLASDERGDQAFIWGAPFDVSRHIYGSIPKNRSSFKIKGAIPDPALLLAKELHDQLKLKGIEVADGFRVEREINNLENEELVIQKQSPKLSEIVYMTNRKSINLYASVLLKHIGLAKTGIGSFNSGVTALSDFWNSRGVNIEGMNIEDGSGLSRANLLTPRQLAIASSYVSEKAESSFVNSLRPYSGRSQLLVKTGYVEFVRSVTGRTTLKDGREVAFCIIINHYRCSATAARKALEKMLKGITME